MKVKATENKILEIVELFKTRIIADLITLSEIPAPSSKEAKRRKKFIELMKRRHFSELLQDEAGNVIGVRKGTKNNKILLSAHIDTIFPETLDHTVKVDMEKIYGLSVGDNALGLAALLTVSEVLDELDIQTKHDILFAGTVRGETDMYGMKKLIANFEKDLECVLCLEGHGSGRIDNVAIGHLRIELGIKVQSGHSFRDFGQPNAISLMSSLINKITALATGEDHKLALNIGHIKGGVAYDSIPPSCYAGIEISYKSKEAFKSLYKQFEEMISKMEKRNGIQIERREISKLPSGNIPKSHLLVKEIVKIHKLLGIKSFFGSFSTGGSIPLSFGIPTVTLGITEGGGLHLPEEYIEIAPVTKGIQQIILLILNIDKYESLCN